jgi:TPR repeat protein
MMLPLILGMLVLPVFPQDEPPPTTGDTSEVSDNITDLITKAEQGDADAQFNLGRMYDAGQGVPKDFREVVRWFRAAAEQGHESAQFSLGFMYFMGEAIPLDYKEAFRWYLAAAEQGNSSAQRSLGAMYRAGRSVPQDYIQAHMWYNLAASSGGDAGRKMAAKSRDSTAKTMTSEQIAEAQRLAREWRPKTGSQ